MISWWLKCVPVPFGYSSNSSRMVWSTNSKTRYNFRRFRNTSIKLIRFSCRSRWKQRNEKVDIKMTWISLHCLDFCSSIFCPLLEKLKCFFPWQMDQLSTFLRLRSVSVLTPICCRFVGRVTTFLPKRDQVQFKSGHFVPSTDDRKKVSCSQN